MSVSINFPKNVPPQKQDKQPGLNSLMNPKPIYEYSNYKGCGKLQDKVAIVTGGDSGIGRAVALAYANEGAKLAIIYLDEHEDAEETKKLIEEKGTSCLILAGDLGDETFCKTAIESIVKQYSTIDILVNNAGEQYPQNSLEDITKEQLEKTFKTNIFSMFYLTKYALPYLKDGSAVINTTSITAYKGHKTLLDYSASKGAIVSFTRSLALSLASRNIRVNAVAPGPIWTPLIPSSFSSEEVGTFGASTSFGRPGQPVELAASYVFLACRDSSFISGETIHINGGEIINS